jgi:putative ABC transport system substrate-binding protein
MQCRVVGLIVTLACGLFCAPLAAIAQQPGKVERVGLLSTVNPRSFYVAFEQHLRELGYVEGHNLMMEFRTAEGHAERLPALAAELVRLQVDVMVTPGPEAPLWTARQATSTSPIVMIAVNYDPIAGGYIESLARPSRNLTGGVLSATGVNGQTP